MTEKLYTLTFEGIASEYFGTEIISGDNAPKLSKQLSKAGIDPTEEELVWFGYLKKLFDRQGDGLDTIFDDIEMVDFYEQDKWAFNGSCNNTLGCGSETCEVLRQIEGMYYLRCYDESGEPAYRAYFYWDGKDEFAHAGGYDRKGSSTNYEETNLILDYLISQENGRAMTRIADYRKCKGLNLPTNETSGLWANMGDSTSYSKWTNSQDKYILWDLGEFYGEGAIWSELEECYISEDEAVWLEYEEKYVSEDYDYIYSHVLDMAFSTYEALHEYLEV